MTKTDNKCDILIITPHLASGGSRVNLNLAKEFSLKGYKTNILLYSNRIDYTIPPITGLQVDYLLSKNRDTSIDQYLSNKSSTLLSPYRKTKLFFKNSPFMRHIINELAAIKNKSFHFKDLKTYINKVNPKIIIGNLGSFDSILMVKSICKFKVPVFIRLDSMASKRKIVAGFTKLEFLYFIYMLKFLLHKADGVICVSKGVKSDLLAINSKVTNANVIYNPIVNDELIEKSKLPIKHKYFNKNIPVILSVQNFNESKDHKTLLRAFKIALKTRELKMILLGNGGLIQNIKKFSNDLGVSQNVSFEGFHENPYPYMRKADLFVLSSNYEGLSIVLAEAMVCGTNVVSTDCPSGPREILEDGKYGKLVPVGDSSALAEAILWQLDNPLCAEVLVERAKFFSVKKSANDHLKLFAIKTNTPLYSRT